MNLLNFIAQFPDEESCKLKYKDAIDKVGVTCSFCGCKKHYWGKVEPLCTSLSYHIDIGL